MELQSGNVVELRNGQVGLVCPFNDANKPFVIVFKNYTNLVSKYQDFKQKNRIYDIVKVYDGSSVEDIKSLYYNGGAKTLPLLWSEE